MALDNYEQTLLEGWEENHKKSQLTLWILLALRDGPKHMQQIKKFMIEQTKGTISADDKSMYRALRRFNDAQMINFSLKSVKGPDLKIYSLSKAGQRILESFIKSNIKSVFFDKHNKQLFLS